MRRKNGERMSIWLSGIAEIEVPHSTDSFFHVYQMYVIRVKDGQEKRDALLAYLGKKGIMSKVYFSPVHFTHFYRKTLGYNCALPVTEKISQQVLTLPMYPSLTEVEINYIADEVAAFFSLGSK